MENLDLEKIKVINKINKIVKEDFIIDKDFNLLELIEQYGLNFILNDLTKLIKKMNNIKD